MNYITYTELFLFVTMMIDLIIYLDNRKTKEKK